MASRKTSERNMYSLAQSGKAPATFPKRQTETEEDIWDRATTGLSTGVTRKSTRAVYDTASSGLAPATFPKKKSGSTRSTSTGYSDSASETHLWEGTGSVPSPTLSPTKSTRSSPSNVSLAKTSTDVPKVSEAASPKRITTMNQPDYMEPVSIALDVDDAYNTIAVFPNKKEDGPEYEFIDEELIDDMLGEVNHRENPGRVGRSVYSVAGELPTNFPDPAVESIAGCDFDEFDDFDDFDLPPPPPSRPSLSQSSSVSSSSVSSTSSSIKKKEPETKKPERLMYEDPPDHLEDAKLSIAAQLTRVLSSKKPSDAQNNAEAIGLPTLARLSMSVPKTTAPTPASTTRAMGPPLPQRSLRRSTVSTVPQTKPTKVSRDFVF